jgi:hypothetical protein
MKTNFFSIEEDQLILDLIHNNNNKTKNELTEILFNKYNKKRKRGSYRAKIDNAINYTLGKGGLENTSNQQKVVIDDFLRRNCKDTFVQKLKDLK